MPRTETLESARKVLEVMSLLFEADYWVGVAPAEIAKALGLTPSAVTRYLTTLEAQDCITRIPETNRVRPSVRWARHASAVLGSLDTTARRIEEVRTRIQTPVH